MIKEAIIKLADKKDLDFQEMQSAMEEIMTGKVSVDQIVLFLTRLRDKIETPDEITAAAIVMRKFVTKISSTKKIVFDTCGTGGDCKGTFNISTIGAFVVAGCGIAVAKHGNRSVSSKCGSADLLEALGVNISMSKEKIQECLEKIGISFLFAPNLHPAMKHTMPARKQIGTRTIFNILGPLTNPANATHQILGVYDKRLIEPLIIVLKNLGLKRALVVYGLDGLDEITTTGESLVSELKDGIIKSYKILPGQFGLKEATLDDLKGADIKSNRDIAKDILDGQTGPKTDIVLLNAACAIYTADKAKNIEEGLTLAKESINSGKAKEKLELLIEQSRSF